MTESERMVKALHLGLCSHIDYERVLNELADMRLEKVIQYGEDRYAEDDLSVNMLMCYSDIYRKHIRLKKLSFNFENPDIESLLDTYRDLANYAVMAIQILERYERTQADD